MTISLLSVNFANAQDGQGRRGNGGGMGPYASGHGSADARDCLTRKNC